MKKRMEQLIEQGWNKEDFVELIKELKMEYSCNSSPKVLLDRIENFVIKLGISQNLIGRKYIIEAVLYNVNALKNGRNVVLKSEWIEVIAKKYGKTPISVDAAIRQAIHTVYEIRPSIQSKLTLLIGLDSDRPRTKEFIMALSTIIFLGKDLKSNPF